MRERRKKELPAYIRDRMSLDEMLASRRVLQLINEKGPLTQGEASEALDLSLGACNLHFQRLAYDGLVQGLKLEEGLGPGRPRLHWDLAREQNATLGLVFDPPRVFVQLEDFATNVLLSQGASLRSCRGPKAVAERTGRLVELALAAARSRKLTIRNAFAALPGVLDPVTGAVLRAVNFPALEGLNVPAVLKDRFALPTNANSLGTAYFYGEAADIPANRTAMVIYWDLGLGFAFGRNRQLLTVQGGEEGGRVISELGHMAVDAKGPVCHCGERGCLEAYAGGWVFLREFAPEPSATLEDLVRMGAEGHEGLLRAIRHVGVLLGRHLAGTIQMLGVTELRVTGPLAPLFEHGQREFLKGLAGVIGSRAQGLAVKVAEDPKARLLAGATRAARRAYIYPEEFSRLSYRSVTMQGQRLAEG